MYMPPTVQVSYNTTYTDTEIGVAANIAALAYQEIYAQKVQLDVAEKALKRS